MRTIANIGGRAYFSKELAYLGDMILITTIVSCTPTVLDTAESKSNDV